MPRLALAWRCYCYLEPFRFLQSQSNAQDDSNPLCWPAYHAFQAILSMPSGRVLLHLTLLLDLYLYIERDMLKAQLVLLHVSLP